MRKAVIFALALLAFAPAARASSFAQYGVQDDAWLMYGPGTLDQRVGTLEQLGPGGAVPARERAKPGGSRLPLGAVRGRSRGAAHGRDPGCRDALGVAEVGERRPPVQRAPESRLRQLRLRCSQAVPVDPPVDG